MSKHSNEVTQTPVRTARAARAERIAQAQQLVAEREAAHEAALAVNAARVPQGFRERHALKVMGGIGAAMFALVIIAQVGC